MFEFISNHWQEFLTTLFAVIGAGYSAALLYVKFTPTPDDNAKLNEVGNVLKTIAELFGLDWTAGASTKNPQEKDSL